MREDYAGYVQGKPFKGIKTSLSACLIGIPSLKTLRGRLWFCYASVPVGISIADGAAAPPLKNWFNSPVFMSFVVTVFRL